MPLETLLTFVVVLGLPLWLAVEEFAHRFSNKRSGPKAQPTIASGARTRSRRRPLETSSRIA